MTDSERRRAAARPFALVPVSDASPRRAAHPGGGDLAAGFDPAVIEWQLGYWEARGTRAALLAAGLCTPSHFPEGRKRSCGGSDLRGRWWHMRLHAGGLCRLTIERPPEECKREAARAEAATSAASLVAGRLRRASQTAADWRAGVHRMTVSGLESLLLSARGEVFPCEPYRLTDRGLAAIEAHWRRLRILIENAELVRQPIDPAYLAELPDDPDRPPRLRAPLRLVRSALAGAKP